MRPATWIRAYGPLAVLGALGGASGPFARVAVDPAHPCPLRARSGPFARVAVETWGTRVRVRPPDGARGVSVA